MWSKRRGWSVNLVNQLVSGFLFNFACALSLLYLLWLWILVMSVKKIKIKKIKKFRNRERKKLLRERLKIKKESERETFQCRVFFIIFMKLTLHHVIWLAYGYNTYKIYCVLSFESHTLLPTYDMVFFFCSLKKLIWGGWSGERMKILRSIEWNQLFVSIVFYQK